MGKNVFRPEKEYEAQMPGNEKGNFHPTPHSGYSYPEATHTCTRATRSRNVSASAHTARVAKIANPRYSGISDALGHSMETRSNVSMPGLANSAGAIVHGSISPSSYFCFCFRRQGGEGEGAGGRGGDCDV